MLQTKRVIMYKYKSISVVRGQALYSWASRNVQWSAKNGCVAAGLAFSDDISGSDGMHFSLFASKSDQEDKIQLAISQIRSSRDATGFTVYICPESLIESTRFFTMGRDIKTLVYDDIKLLLNNDELEAFELMDFAQKCEFVCQSIYESKYSLSRVLTPN